MIFVHNYYAQPIYYSYTYVSKYCEPLTDSCRRLIETGGTFVEDNCNH